jgi:hypothetical protein
MLATPVAPSGWPFGEETAADVHGRLAAVLEPALVDGAARLALLAEAEVLVVQQLGGGEAVVQLDEVEIVGADAGAIVRDLGGVARERVDVGHGEIARRPRDPT